MGNGFIAGHGSPQKGFHVAHFTFCTICGGGAAQSQNFLIGIDHRQQLLCAHPQIIGLPPEAVTMTLSSLPDGTLSLQGLLNHLQIANCETISDRVVIQPRQGRTSEPYATIKLCGTLEVAWESKCEPHQCHRRTQHQLASRVTAQEGLLPTDIIIPCFWKKPFLGQLKNISQTMNLQRHLVCTSGVASAGLTLAAPVQQWWLKPPSITTSAGARACSRGSREPVACDDELPSEKTVILLLCFISQSSSV